ncbi:MAG: hypothetical protein A2107_11425 [Verrucomicrobia bacterium GWF2_62_7]|nr:MAG: hypothetical protein A2107_11425 [Verrucomicrobia bacterium GWF2_62_7]
MKKHLYTLLRDLHLYAGLFLAPYLLVFSVSVFFLVHAWIPGQSTPAPPRMVTDLPLPPNVESLDGRARVEALRTVLPALGVTGEIGFVRYIPNDHNLFFPVFVPGRETTVGVDLTERTATVTQHDLGIWDGLVTLHKSPGQHLVAIRMNWFPMRAWRWFADGTAYLILFTTLSGLYLWAVMRAERGPGFALLAAGVLSFVGMVYAVIH